MLRLAAVLTLLSALGWIYWRLRYFFRDPERDVPEGRNIVSPADGKVVYVHLVEDGQLPISVKNGKSIRLDEITKTELALGRYWHVGVFMFPWDVHVNRIPLDGEVTLRQHCKNANRPMSTMYMRAALGLGQIYKNGLHVTENERNTILINGELPAYVVQIADAYVNKIECWVGPGDRVRKGQRLGRIIMGSQVDLIFPQQDGIRIVVREGQHVTAGETIIAYY